MFDLPLPRATLHYREKSFISMTNIFPKSSISEIIKASACIAKQAM